MHFLWMFARYNDSFHIKKSQVLPILVQSIQHILCNFNIGLNDTFMLNILYYNATTNLHNYSTLSLEVFIPLPTGPCLRSQIILCFCFIYALVAS